MNSRPKNSFEVLAQRDSTQLRVSAGTIEDVFRESLRGLAVVLHRGYAHTCVTPLAVPIKVSSVDVSSLLVDFLSEVLYQSELHKVIFSDLRLKHFTNTELSGEISGCGIARFERPIRLVSYEAARFLRGEDRKWHATISLEL
jgi:SHS2 domain-containing protein